MSKYTKEEILKSAQENGVEFIRLQFTDVFGIMKNVAITSSQLEKALDNECMFDGSSIDGFVRINESDMYLHPDYDTWTIFPWRKHQNAQTARLICSVYCADNETPFLGDPRNVLQKVMNEAAEMGYSFNVGPECEFFLFKLDETVIRQLQQVMRAVTLTLTQSTMAKTAVVIFALLLRKWDIQLKHLTMRLLRDSTKLISNLMRL